MERVARLASRNEHKLWELQQVLPGWELAPLEAGDDYPVEEGRTYYDNARAKAHFGRRVAGPGIWVLGEDSGLEVNGLGGGPGINSSRFAPDGDFVGRLLDALSGIEDDGLSARYVCELVCLAPGGKEYRGTGTLHGTIADHPRGSEGFGYDPIFVPDGESESVAELGNDWKARDSHRARAAASLREAIEGQGL